MERQDVFIREVRVNYYPTEEKLFDIRSPDDAARFVRRILTDNSREHFVALYLNGSHSVASYSIISIGTANQSLVSPVEVFQRAVLCGATAMVIAHNHPSGSLLPSEEDKHVTAKIKDAGQLLGIKILDHIIVTDTGMHSMKESGGLL